MEAATASAALQDLQNDLPSSHQLQELSFAARSSKDVLHQSREHVFAQQHHKHLQTTDKAHDWRHALANGRRCSMQSVESLRSAGGHGSTPTPSPSHRNRASRVGHGHSSGSRFRSLMYLLEQEHERELHAARNHHGSLLTREGSGDRIDGGRHAHDGHHSGSHHNSSHTSTPSHNGHLEMPHSSFERVVAEAFREREAARAAKRQSAFHKIPASLDIDVNATVNLRPLTNSSHGSTRSSAMIGCVFPPTPPALKVVGNSSSSRQRSSLLFNQGIRTSVKTHGEATTGRSRISVTKPQCCQEEHQQVQLCVKEPKSSIPSEEKVPLVPAFSGPRTNLLQTEACAELDSPLTAKSKEMSMEHASTDETKQKKQSRVTFEPKNCVADGSDVVAPRRSTPKGGSSGLQKVQEEKLEEEGSDSGSDRKYGSSVSGSGDDSFEVYNLTRLSAVSSFDSEDGEDYRRGTMTARTGHIVFTLHNTWANPEENDNKEAVDLYELQRAQTHDTLGELQVLLMADPNAEDKLERGESKLNLQRFVLSPSNAFSQMCDVLLMLIVLYDAIAIPLVVFDLPETWWTWFMDWLIRIVWTVEIPRSFCTGYLLKNGTAEMRPRLIASHYLKTWFIFDCCIAGFDWVEWLLLSGLNLDMSRQGGIVRLMARFRVARILPRIMRMSRLPSLSEKMSDYFYSQKNILFLGILKVSIVFIFLVHYIACSWYAIGTYSSGQTWLDDYTWWDQDFAYRYAICLHWAITQFLGNSEVTPVNLQERYFSGLVLIFTFLMSASFVSRLAASMTRLHMLSGQTDVKIALLRQYLSHNKVPAELCGRVVRSAEYAERQKAKIIQEADVDLLAFLTEPLMIEIHFEVYSKTLCLHPFFTHFQRIDISTMRRVCHRAVAAFSLAAGDVLFNIGERPTSPQMFFLTKGTMLYIKADGRYLVEEGTFICEKVLWTTWVHVGTLCTFSNCSLVSVDATELQAVMSGKHSAQFAIEYAKAYLEHLNETMREDAFMVDDLNDGDFQTAEKTREIAGALERRKRQHQFTGGGSGSGTQSALSVASPATRNMDMKRFTTVGRLSKSMDIAARFNKSTASNAHQRKDSKVVAEASIDDAS